MKTPHEGRRIFWMVRLLAVVGLTTIVVLIILMGRQISVIRAERLKLHADQEGLYQTSEEILRRASEARGEIVAILDDNAAPKATGAANRLQEMVDRLVRSANHPSASETLVELDTLTNRLAEIERRALSWRVHYDAIWQDVGQQRTLGQVRELVTGLRGALETLEGRQRLQQAIEFKRWRAAKGEDATRLAQTVLVEQDQKRDLADALERNLAEIESLVELLGGEEQPDNLPNLKDNKLAPALERFSRGIDQWGSSPSGEDALTPLAIERLTAALFGEGYTKDQAHQTIRLGTGGLYALRRDILLLRKDREELRGERSALSHEIDAKVAVFMQSARVQSEALAEKAEQNLASNWWRMTIVGVSCSVFFAWLAWLISRAIRQQVRVIEQAKAEAESGRHQAQLLTEELHTRNDELTRVGQATQAANARLQESEERLRQIFEHASQVFYSHTVDGRLTYVSPQAQDFFDCPSTEVLQPWTDFLTDNPGNAEGILLTRRAIESGETQRPYQLELRSRQGRLLWVEVHESPMVVQGRTVAIVGALTDITARKQAEARQHAEEERFLHQRDALITFTGGSKDSENLTATIQRLTETDAKTMGVARVSVWRYNSDRTAIQCLDLYELAEDRHSAGVELPAAAYPGYFRALEELDVIAAEDAHRDPRTCEFSEGYLRPLGITSMLDAPIHLGTAGAGVLCHEHIGPPRRWTTDEETFAVAVANRVSLALEGSERKQAEEELRSAHAQLEQMVTYSPALIYRLKVDGESFIPVAVSANVTALLGYAVAEVLNREWWPAQLHPEDRERVFAGSSEATGPGSSRAEYRVRHKAGGYRWIEDHRRVLCDAAGQPLEIIGVWMDITERKQAEESLRLLSSAVEQSRESILVTDAELDRPGPRIVFANPAYLQMTGYATEEIIGKTPRMMQGPRSNRAALRRLRHNLERGEAFSGETVNYRKDGTEYDQEWQVAPIRNAAGKITHFVSIQHDITERKRAEQELQASQEHMRLQTAALESAANGVAITDAKGTIQWINQAFTRLTGYTPEEAIGRNPRVLKSGRHPESYYKGMWQTLSAGRVWRGEIVNRRKDGEFYHEAMTITPIRDDGGVTTHYIAIKQDISERKRNEASIQEMHKQLLDASRQAGMAEIATNVLHNVGNVLNSVNVSVSVATEKARGLKVATLERLATMLGGQPDLGAFFASDPRGAEVPAFLTRIAGRIETDRAAVLGELDALRQHVDHINEIVAMQQNYAKVCGVTEVLPLVDLIEDALRLNAGSIERHGLEVIRDFAEVPPIPVDRHKVLQILVNLIRNAKFALDDGAPPEKRLTLRLTRSDDGHAQIIVSDNGVGIPPENITRIFEHGFTTRKDGHGFGLHSSANAAGEMGGSLAAQSDGPGRGATFTLELPLPSQPAQL